MTEPADPGRRVLLDRFASAFENADVAALAALLREDVTLEMPPMLTWFAGREAVAGFFASRALTEPGRFRLVPVMANGQPGFAVYERDSEGSYQAYGVTVPRSPRPGSRGSSRSSIRACSGRSAFRRSTTPWPVQVPARPGRARPG